MCHLSTVLADLSAELCFALSCVWGIARIGVGMNSKCVKFTENASNCAIFTFVLGKELRPPSSMEGYTIPCALR